MYNYPELFANLGKLERIMIDFTCVEDRPLIYKIIAVSLLADSVWLMSSIFLLVGNAIHSFCFVTTWIICSLIITLRDIGATSYFAIRLWHDFEACKLYFMEVVLDMTRLPNTANLILTVLFSQGIIFILLDIASMIVVCKRNEQIYRTKPNKKQNLIGLCTIASSGDKQSPLTSTSSYGEKEDPCMLRDVTKF